MSDGIILAGKSISNTGKQSYNLDFLERDSGGELLYLDGLWLDVNMTTVATSAGISVKELYDFVSAVQIKAGRSWGPQVMPGSSLAALHYLAAGLPIPFTTANGDAAEGAGAGAARRFQVPLFCPSYFGADGNEFTPLLNALKDGTVNVTFDDGSADFDTLEFEATIYARAHRELKVKAVAALMFAEQELQSPRAKLPIDGPSMLLQHSLWKPGSNRIAGEVTEMILRGDGIILNLADVENLRPRDYYHNPEMTSARMCRHFCDAIGGTNINGLPVYPGGPSRGVPLSAHPTASSFMQIIQGSLTTEEYSNLTAYAEEPEHVDIEKQWASVKCVGSAAAAAKSTKNGNGNANDRIAPYLPWVFTDPSGVEKT